MEASRSSGVTIAVFGGSRVDRGSPLYSEAYQVGQLLARAGFTVINGGYTGTMEGSARGAREAGGRVVGVTSKIFESRLNEYVDEEIPTDDLYNRIRELIVRGNGYVVLRGSIGTLAELSIVWNVGTLDPAFRKPIVLLGDNWREVVHCYRANLAVTEEQTRYLRFASTPEQCVQLLQDAINEPLQRPPTGDGPLPRAPSP